MLVNTIEAAQLSKKIKDNMESELPKDASRYKIKALIENYIIDELDSYDERKSGEKKNHPIKRFSPFEGSPLHVFLLEELVSLDKLDVLGLPDDFKYKGEPFYKYYQDHIVKEINTFRVNKLFRRECIKRLHMAKDIAKEVIEKNQAEKYFEVLDSDGSFLFNILLKEFFSYQDLEKFTKKLAEQRGISVVPYLTGFLRFSLGDYVEGSDRSYDIFSKEFENSLRIVLKYWKLFYEAKTNPETKGKTDRGYSGRNLPNIVGYGIRRFGSGRLRCYQKSQENIQEQFDHQQYPDAVSCVPERIRRIDQYNPRFEKFCF